MADPAQPRRNDFNTLRPIATRWLDNDHYGHAACVAIALTGFTAAESLSAQPASAPQSKGATARQGPAAAATRWVMPRTADGRPDLQGNWTNETQTPLERMSATGGTLTDAQAAAIEQRALDVEEYRDKASDPNRPAPKKGGEANNLSAPGERSFIEQISEAAGSRR